MDIKITIITVCFNAEQTLRETIQSVLGQTFQDYEYLIIDGNSSDKTLDIVKEYKSDKIKLYSEDDRGIYNAMNKGIAKAKGEYLYFLNAGDSFFSNTILESVNRELSNNRPSLLYGNVRLLYQNKYKSRISDFGNLGMRALAKVFKGSMPCHQSMFVRNDVMFTRYFNESYKIRADYDLFVYLFRYKYNIKYIELTIANYPAYGISSCKTQRLRKLYIEETKQILTNYYPVQMRFREIIDQVFGLVTGRQIWKYI